MIDNPSFSLGVRDYLQSSGLLRPKLGMLARLLIALEAADASERELAGSDHRGFVLRLEGGPDQRALRNLLIWQNLVLGVHPGCGDDRAVDVLLLLSDPAGDAARTFDLVSIALLLPRIRNLALFWDADSLEAALPLHLSVAERARWTGVADAVDLARLPPALIEEVERKGTTGGIKLLPDGRKRVQDYCKVAFRGHWIIAVGLREDADGAVEDLDAWLPLLDVVAARRPDVAFAVLNCVPPSQWRAWPAHLRFPRHQGLSFQDALCFAQVADGYVGVLDILGLAANAAGRPGAYVPLVDGAGGQGQKQGHEQGHAPGQVMVGSRDPARIAAAVEHVLAELPPVLAGAFLAAPGAVACP